jgi:translation initiation factor 1A
MVEENKEFTESQEFGEGAQMRSEIENQPGFARVRIPRGREVIGKVETRAGANRMIISCFDGKTRNCRVPGRLKRALWIRPGNIVLIEPWAFEGDKKGDIIFSYTPAAVQWLERKGYLKGITNEF